MTPQAKKAVKSLQKHHEQETRRKTRLAVDKHIDAAWDALNNYPRTHATGEEKILIERAMKQLEHASENIIMALT